MFTHVKAPNSPPTSIFGTRVFLAGSIEMGSAEKWQDRVAEFFFEDAVTLLNPRRDDWDSSWKQDISNPKFKEQVRWELDWIERADMVLMYFDPSTQSPISLMELGYLAGLDASCVIVVCPQGFWRKGNVDFICERQKFTQFETLDQAMNYIKTLL
jgi:hypothetical protein